MAISYTTNAGKVLQGTGTPAPGFANGTVRNFTDVLTYASQASGDTIHVGYLPKGAVVHRIVLTTDTSTGSATIAIGIAGTTAKYKAAAAFTATDTPTAFGKAAALGVALTAEEDIIITTGGASLPASGVMVIAIFYSVN